MVFVYEFKKMSHLTTNNEQRTTNNEQHGYTIRKEKRT